MGEPVTILNANTSEERAQRVRSEMWYFLNQANKMILGYKNERGEVVQSMMLYVIDNDFSFYFGTLRRFPKYEFLIQNPTISLVIQEQQPEPEKYVSVRATVVEEINEQELIDKIHEYFKEKNPCKYHIKKYSDFVFFKARPLSLRMTMAQPTGGILRKDLLL